MMFITFICIGSVSAQDLDDNTTIDSIGISQDNNSITEINNDNIENINDNEIVDTDSLKTNDKSENLKANYEDNNNLKADDGQYIQLRDHDSQNQTIVYVDSGKQISLDWYWVSMGATTWYLYINGNQTDTTVSSGYFGSGSWEDSFYSQTLTEPGIYTFKLVYYSTSTQTSYNSNNLIYVVGSDSIVKKTTTVDLHDTETDDKVITKELNDTVSFIGALYCEDYGDNLENYITIISKNNQRTVSEGYDVYLNGELVWDSTNSNPMRVSPNNKWKNGFSLNLANYGWYNFTVVYNGNTFLSGSTSNVLSYYVPSPVLDTVTTVRVDKENVKVLDNYTITPVVRNLDGSDITEGEVEVFVNGVSVGRVAPGGSIVYNASVAGTDVVTGKYLGVEGKYDSSETGAGVNVVVTKYSTYINLYDVASGNNSTVYVVVGDSVQFIGALKNDDLGSGIVNYIKTELVNGDRRVSENYTLFLNGENAGDVMVVSPNGDWNNGQGFNIAAPGFYNVTVKYAGNDYLEGSESTVLSYYAPEPVKNTTTTITVDKNNVKVLDVYTITPEVRDQDGNLIVAVGEVEIYINGKSVGKTVTGTSFDYNASIAGTDVITAKYLGSEGTYNPSEISNELKVNVTKYSTYINLYDVASGNNSTVYVVVGDSVQFIGALKNDDLGSGIVNYIKTELVNGNRKVSENYTLYFNGVNAGDVMVVSPNGDWKNGQGFNIAAPGFYNVTVKYAGNDYLEGSESNLLSYYAPLFSTDTTVVVNESEVKVLDNYTITPVVRDLDGSDVTEGEVEVFVNGVSVGRVAPGGSIVYNAGVAGTDVVTGRYLGVEGKYDSSETGAGVNVVVTKYSTYINLYDVASGNDSTVYVVVGDSVQFIGALKNDDLGSDIINYIKTEVVNDALGNSIVYLNILRAPVTVNSTSYKVSENFTLFLNGEDMGNIMVVSPNGDWNNGQGFNITSPGWYNITVKYAGSDYLEESESNVLSYYASKINTTVTLFLNESEIDLGESVSVVPVVTDVDGNNITEGTVEVYANGVLLGAVAPGDSIDYTPNSTGEIVFTAKYLGADNYNESNSTDVLLTVYNNTVIPYHNNTKSNATNNTESNNTGLNSTSLSNNHTPMSEENIAGGDVKEESPEEIPLTDEETGNPILIFILSVLSVFGAGIYSRR